MEINEKDPIVQFVKFIMVGVLNTGLTLIIIYLCKSVLGINEYVSNLVGYVAGVINSFLWNKNWVFKVKNHLLRQAAVFLLGFGICYLLQLLVVFWITDCTPYGDMTWTIESYTISGYGIATIVGMGVYTVANFIYNRVVTFHRTDD